MQCDKVSNSPDLIKLHELNPKLRRLLCWDQRIIPHSLRGGEKRSGRKVKGGEGRKREGRGGVHT